MAQQEKTIRVIAAMTAMQIPAHRIGLTLGLSADYINTLRRTDLYKQFEEDFLVQLEKEAFTVEREIQDMSKDALEVQRQVLAGSLNYQGVDGGEEKRTISPKLRSDTARDILDRAGHKKPEQINLAQGTDPWMLVLSAEDFEEKYGKEQEHAADLEEDLIQSEKDGG